MAAADQILPARWFNPAREKYPKWKKNMRLSPQNINRNSINEISKYRKQILELARSARSHAHYNYR